MDWPTILGILGGIATAAATGAGVVWRFMVAELKAARAETAKERAENKRLTESRHDVAMALAAHKTADGAQYKAALTLTSEVLRQATLTMEARSDR